MPKERPELKGEPLGWGETKFTQKDGSEVVIEKAFCIDDICKIRKSRIRRTSLICFYTSQVHGPIISYLEIEGFEHSTPTAVTNWSAKVSNIKEMTEKGVDFFENIPFLSKKDGVKEILNLID
jgi:hypothetical protein